ncbi:hypothetical protein [Burkholderia multivorans]|uniref:hypothetical protein n=1 Tax=Burkholderia multivorans TaxID=87883 RepID=UPI0011B22FE2|nr:hypothetical protein [Burkholderia multivorans]
MKRIINLTPHTLNIFNSNSEEIVIAPSGIIARRVSNKTQEDEVNGIALFKTSYSRLIFEDKDKQAVSFNNDSDAIYVVSSLCLNGVDTPANFFAPGEQIRDSEGKPIGAKGLTR